MTGRAPKVNPPNYYDLATDDDSVIVPDDLVPDVDEDYVPAADEGSSDEEPYEHCDLLTQEESPLRRPLRKHGKKVLWEDAPCGIDVNFPPPPPPSLSMKSSKRKHGKMSDKDIELEKMKEIQVVYKKMRTEILDVSKHYGCEDLVTLTKELDTLMDTYKELQQIKRLKEEKEREIIVISDDES